MNEYSERESMVSGEEESSSMSRIQPKGNEDDQEGKIATAIRFWKHPSLRDIPIEQKRHYLHGKGITDEQIHQAWDRILEQDDSNISTEFPSSTIALPGELSTMRSFPSSATHLQASTRDPIHSGNMPYPSHQAPALASSYPSYRYDEEEGPGPFLRGVSLVALGGFVGLTAAAATRWLNGGEFELLPPSVSPKTYMKDQRLVVQGHRGEENVIEEEEEHAEGSDEEEEEYMEDEQSDEEVDQMHIAQLPEDLMEQVQSIAESMKAHVSLQEKILQKLSTNQGSSITNQSMDLLRASSVASNVDDRRRGGPSSKHSQEALQLWAELLQIKGEIRAWQDDSRDSPTIEDGSTAVQKIDRTMTKLESCIQAIAREFEIEPESEQESKPETNEAITDHINSKDEEEDLIISSPTVRQSIAKMIQTEDDTKFRVACQLIYLYLINLIGAPKNPRYRKIFTSNDNFKKVESLAGAKSLLLSVGFKENTGYLEWLSGSSLEDEELAMSKVREAAKALGILKSGKLSPELASKALEVIPQPDALESTHVEVEALNLESQEQNGSSETNPFLNKELDPLLNSGPSPAGNQVVNGHATTNTSDEEAHYE